MKNNMFEWGFETEEPNPVSVPITARRAEERGRKEICNFSEIRCLADLERISEEVVWQNFEKLTAFVFGENDFLVETNIVKTMKKRRRQYDVIAKNAERTLLVECKKWAGSRPRLSALKKAILQHNERCEFYRAVTGVDAYPIVVTLVEEEIKSYEGTPIVPIMKLDSFIREMALNGYDFQIYENQDHRDLENENQEYENQE